MGTILTRSQRGSADDLMCCMVQMIRGSVGAVLVGERQNLKLGVEEYLRSAPQSEDIEFQRVADAPRRFELLPAAIFSRAKVPLRSFSR